MPESSTWMLAAVLNPADLEGLDAKDLVFGASYANVLASRTQLALRLQQENRHGDAEPILWEVLATRQNLLGANHPHTFQTAVYLGYALQAQRKYSHAEDLYRQTLVLSEGKMDDAQSAAVSSNLGMALLLQRKFDGAEILCRQVQDRYEEKLGQNHPSLRVLYETQEALAQIRISDQESAISEYEKQLVPPATKQQPQAKRFVARSYQKALQSRDIMKEELQLIQSTRDGAVLFATSRNTIELSYPGLDDLLGTEELDLLYPVCSICASANPWWRETAGGFNMKMVAGTPEYVRELKAADIARSGKENGCFYCQLLSYGLSEYSQHYYSSDNGWKEKVIKIRIKGSPTNATLCVGSRKTEMVQIFTLSGDEIPCAAIGVANYVAKSPLNAIDGLSQLLKGCLTSHTQCGGEEAVALPTRVIEIGSTNEDLRILETNGAKGTYMTLSYCWGETADDARTTQANISSRLKRLPISELGTTHRDAVEITRKFGVKYLWIDAVCIIQGDKDDWDKESIKMASVYMNSMLTIAAAQSTHAQGGILIDRPDLTSEARLLTYSEGDKQRRIAYRLPITNHYVWANCVTKQYYPLSPGDMEYLPLENRAWCLQERVLSRRIVHFAKDEYFWECRQARRCECGEIGGHKGFGGSATLRDDFNNAISSTSQDDRTFFWMGVVAECTRRGIKYCNDRLPALSGIAQSLHQAGYGEYIAGIWRNGLLEQIMWTVDNFETARRAQPANAPTWSWASIETSSISFHVDPYNTGKHCAEIEDARCTPSSTGLFGKDLKGSLRLAAPVVRAKLCWFQQRDGKFTIGFPGARRQMALGLSIPGEPTLVCNLEPDFRLLNPDFDEWTKTNTVSRMSHDTSMESSQSVDASGASLPIQPNVEIDVAIIAIMEHEQRSDDSGGRLSCLAVRQTDSNVPVAGFERVGLVSIDDGNSVARYLEIQRNEVMNLV